MFGECRGEVVADGWELAGVADKYVFAFGAFVVVEQFGEEFAGTELGLGDDLGRRVANHGGLVDNIDGGFGFLVQFHDIENEAELTCGLVVLYFLVADFAVEAVVSEDEAVDGSAGLNVVVEAVVDGEVGEDFCGAACGREEFEGFLDFLKMLYEEAHEGGFACAGIAFKDEDTLVRAFDEVNYLIECFLLAGF